MPRIILSSHKLHPRRLTPAAFRPFGRLIRYPGKGLKHPRYNLFRIVLTEKARRGWRIAYLIVRDKKIRRLEQHPDSYESFEPLQGRSLLFVSRSPCLDRVRCFLLDRPVILNKGIWHGVVAVGRESEIKLTENSRVVCRYARIPVAIPG